METVTGGDYVTDVYKRQNRYRRRPFSKIHEKVCGKHPFHAHDSRWDLPLSGYHHTAKDGDPRYVFRRFLRIATSRDKIKFCCCCQVHIVCLLYTS